MWEGPVSHHMLTGLVDISLSYNPSHELASKQ